MTNLSGRAKELVGLFLSEYQQDRTNFPLWTYDSASWEAQEAAWLERLAWSPATPAKSVLGQASGFQEYLIKCKYLGEPWSDGSWLEAFVDWPQARAMMHPEGTGRVAEQLVVLPELVQAHVAALYAARSDPIPANAADVSVPEHLDRLSPEAVLADVRALLDAIYAAVEAAVTGQDKHGVPILERLLHDHSRRLAHDKWTRKLLGYIERKKKGRGGMTLDDLWWLRKELQPGAGSWHVLQAIGVMPRLQGDRKTALSDETVRELYTEALEIVRLWRRWTPTDEQRIALAELLLSDPTWTPGPKLAGLSTLVECVRRERPGPPGPSILVERHARWLRFPWLDRWEPRPRRDGPEATSLGDDSEASNPPLDQGRDKQAARALLASVMPGHPKDATLENILSRAR